MVVRGSAQVVMREKSQYTDLERRFNTKDQQYTARLATQGSVWWKKALNVQAVYRWNLRRLNPGFTLDIGCGIGRNLSHLDGHGIGIDHNSASIQIARSRGLQAFTPEEFQATEFNTDATFDSILLSHVAEHMSEIEVVQLLKSYLRMLKPDGRVILITPQEYGYASDQTHVQFMDFEALRSIVIGVGLIPVRQFSFPFPRIFGRLFKYNEFVFVSRKA